MNTISIMGRIAKDLELRTTPNGKYVLSFSVAVNERYNGENKVTFFNCVAWGKTAEFVAQYFNKGKMVALTGKMQNNPYTDKNGNNRDKWEINVNEVFFCGDDKKQATKSETVESEEFIDVEFDLDDVPF
jgi:single stranded DNA-binding protein (ssb)